MNLSLKQKLFWLRKILLSHTELTNDLFQSSAVVDENPEETISDTKHMFRLFD